MPDDESSLRFGMFVMPIHDPAKPMAQCFDEDLELAVLCEQLGFHEFWVGEHHSSTVENIVMPEIFLGKVLGLTRSMRLGAAPVCLQYHHPVHVASRLAFLDHLSHGRLNVCFGPGAIPSDMEIYGIDPKRSGAMVAESIDAILQLWTTDPPHEFHGQFWNFELKENIDPEMGIGATHKPLQRPHPPIAAPCIVRDSKGIEKAAARGFQPFSHHMVALGVLANHWETYCKGSWAAGRQPDISDWKVSRNIYVAESDEEARRLASQNSVGKCIEYILELTRRGPGVGMWKRDPDMADEDCNLDYFLDEIIIAGKPETVIRQIQELRQEIGPFGTLVLVAHDWDDRDRWVHSLRLFGSEVMPALQ